MSAHEMMGNAYDYMRNDMRGKLGGYMVSLERRYGDPSVYAQQREQMAAEQAEVIYSEAKTREEALSAAYEKNRQRIRKQHASRMAQFAREKPPRYLEVDPEPGPTDEPPSDAHPPPPRVARARSRASAR